jgi:hypothetical protein
MLDPAAIHTISAHLDRMDAKTKTLLQPFRQEPSADPWICHVLFAYFHYFVQVLFEHADPIRAEQALVEELHPLATETSTLPLDLSIIETQLGERFRAREYTFLGGYTLPYRGPYIWKRTEQRVFDVELPHCVQPVTVYFLHDFLMRSWLHFQTYGTHGTGGWYKHGDSQWSDGLYCVVDAWPNHPLEDDVAFRVSLLKHEAQHLADHREFGALNPIDAEYRAKLVELLAYSTHMQRLDAFLSSAQDDRAKPHAFAEHLILTQCAARLFSEPGVREMRQWQTVPYDHIRGVAEQLLQEHTTQLRSQTDQAKGVL